jgi:all-trans-retinol 13,14-reductase
MTGSRPDADVIVVGAGAGGLTAAAYLAAAGRQVTVVDRQSMAGGNTAVFTHEGYEFDIGLHYLGGQAIAQPAVRAVLEPLDIELTYREQDPDGFDTLLFDDMTFEVPKGLEAFRRRLHEAFPNERHAIDRYLARISAVAEALELRPPRRAGEAPRYVWSARRSIAAAFTTLGRELNRLDCSPRLRAVLSWIHGVYGLPPSRVALGMHAAVSLHYLRGAWYPEGGAQVVSNRLVDVIREHGGQLLLDLEVDRILMRDGAVDGVRLRPGRRGTTPPAEELHAPVVISNADLKRTLLELLPPGVVPNRLRRRVRRFELPAPLFIVYLVIDRDLRAEGVPNRNWAVIDYDDLESMYAACASGQLPSQQGVWITSASLKDPTNPRLCRPGQTNLQLMSIAPASHAFWDVGEDLVAGPRYQERKRQLRDRLVSAAERAIPGLAEAIAYEEAATPISLERHLGSSGGTSYGIAATPRQFGIRRPASHTPINGLFLAGASTRSGHGITGAMLGGVEAASAVLHRSALKSLRATVNPTRPPGAARQSVVR